MELLSILALIISIPGCILAVIELTIIIKKHLDKK